MYGSYSPVLTKEQTNSLLRTVYNWMMLGLFLSGITAFFTATSFTMQRILFSNPMTMWILLFAELGLVFAISGGVNRMASSTAAGLFILFSVVNGLTLSSIFLIYEIGTIATTFFVTGLTFGATSFYGYVTKTDLSSFGKYLFMALIGIIIASVANIFLHSSGLDWIISYVGVLLFVGLTAYDTQKIKRMGEQAYALSPESFRKVAIIGALALYLDFINLFLFLLRIFGGRRD
jgi:FtsH-binding integral membrane protein